MDLYKRIKQRREELGMSQDELAKKLGYKSRSTIAKIEKGENDITQSKITAFAKALNTTPRDLMGWNNYDASDNMISTDENKDAIHKSGRPGRSARHNLKVNDLIKSNQLIESRRKELGLTMEDVAKKVGVSKSTVKKWESGYIKNMRRDKMALLAEALQISPMDLLGDTADDGQGYYADPDVVALAEELRTDPDRRILFDATKDLSKDDIDIVLNLINGLKAKEGKK